ncbi:MAG: DEAD/DEAH box helicase [Desulfovibrionaceae bacterium]|nr:DEAD/DEAH box helicase [Desulfovibrionaceae bacterium]
MNFDSFDLNPRLLANVAALGYTAPTPIQEQAIPPVALGRDVMGLAQTGTGKTAAFLLPIINKLLDAPIEARPKIKALIVAPTRELAQQIADASRDLTRQTKIRTITIYGGVALSPQTRNLHAGAHIVVACPGRLLDHIGQGHVDLTNLTTLVLDEADHMFDMGFLPDIKKILSHLPKERQTLLFSATMPGDIRRLAQEILRNPATVSIGRSAPADTVSHAAYPVRADLKTALLLNLIGGAKDGSVLVFTRTKHRAKRLAGQLERAGHKATSLQGNLSQRQRQAALDGFRDGAFRVLVATDIAARGIDVTRVAHVVNYDIPDTPEAYTHRIGRTGRAERTGQAHSLITGEDMAIIRAIERLIGKPLPRVTLEDFDYDAPVTERDVDAPRAPFYPRGAGAPGNRAGARPGARQGERQNTGRSSFGQNRPGSGGQGRPQSRPQSGRYAGNSSSSAA